MKKFLSTRHRFLLYPNENVYCCQAALLSGDIETLTYTGFGWWISVRLFFKPVLCV